MQPATHPDSRPSSTPGSAQQLTQPSTQRALSSSGEPMSVGFDSDTDSPVATEHISISDDSSYPPSSPELFPSTPVLRPRPSIIDSDDSPSSHEESLTEVRCFKCLIS
jgi:hypothetical protein